MNTVNHQASLLIGDSGAVGTFVRYATTLTTFPHRTMPSFRERLLSLALADKSRALQQEFEDAASICKSKEAAMAFGYLLGKEDASKEEASIYDLVCTLFEQVNDGSMEVVDAVDVCFGLVYKWLDKMYASEGYDPRNDDYYGARSYLAKAFEPLVKPGVVPPFKDEENE